MKDAQQVAVVDGLINDFFMDIELIPVETNGKKTGLPKAQEMSTCEQKNGRKHPLSIKPFSAAPS